MQYGSNNGAVGDYTVSVYGEMIGAMQETLQNNPNVNTDVVISMMNTGKFLKHILLNKFNFIYLVIISPHFNLLLDILTKYSFSMCFYCISLFHKKKVVIFYCFMLWCMS